ncbi:MAG TPA: hypothetical protein VGJ95_23980 [Pseudonocardiaceae bacterium]
MLRRHLAQGGDGVLTAPALALFAEVEMAAGRVDEANALADRLATIAAETPVPYLRAVAEFVAGTA